MRPDNDTGDLMGPGMDLAMSLSGILMIVVFVTVAQLWAASSKNKRMQATNAQMVPIAGLQDCQREIAKSKDTVQNLSARLRGAEDQLARRGAELKDASDRAEGAASRLLQLQGTLNVRNRELGGCQDRNKVLDSRILELQALAVGRTNEIAQMQGQLAALDRRLNDKPPLITISDARFRTFEEASAEISPELSRYLATIVADLRKLGSHYDAHVIEVIGHTDEVPVGAGRRQTCNLDGELLHSVNGRKSTRTLEACDNVGLGMARAAAIVSELRTLGLERDFILLPLSAGQAIETGGTLADGARTVRSTPARRRIEIRLRRSGEWAQ